MKYLFLFSILILLLCTSCHNKINKDHSFKDHNPKNKLDCIDRRDPIIICHTGIILSLPKDEKELVIHASDFIISSRDDCDMYKNLQFYFDGDEKKKTIKIDCEDFANSKAHDELMISVTIWIKDRSNKTNKVLSNLIIQDIHHVCNNID